MHSKKTLSDKGVAIKYRSTTPPSSLPPTDCGQTESEDKSPIKANAGTSDVDTRERRTIAYDPTYANHIFDNKFSREVQTVTLTFTSTNPYPKYYLSSHLTCCFYCIGLTFLLSLYFSFSTLFNNSINWSTIYFEFPPTSDRSCVKTASMLCCLVASHPVILRLV